MPFRAYLCQPAVDTNIMKKVILAIAISSFGLLSFSMADKYLAYFQLFQEMFTIIDENYVEEVKKDELLYVAMKSVASSLDPFSDFYDAKETAERKKKWSGISEVGIGAKIFMRSGLPVIFDTKLNSPALKDDLRYGDMILKINGEETRGKTKKEITALLEGEEGTAVQLALQRPTVGTFDQELIRAAVPSTVVPYYGMYSDSIGYIKMSHFYGKAAFKVKRALNGLKSNPAMKGLIMDMRGNYGGSVRQAVIMANLFLDNNKLVYYRQSKNGRKDYMTTDDPVDADLPIVFLCDENTASAAELVLGAMQDYDRGVIMGRPTLGKSIVQSTYYIADTTSVYFTTSRYHSPSGRCLQKLDYSKNYLGEKPQQYPDELKSEYRTTNQRIVRDYEAIVPDVEFLKPETNDFVKKLSNSYAVFDWCNKYRNQRSNDLKPREFFLTEEEFNEFVAFAKKGGFDFTASGQKEIGKLREALLKDGEIGEFENALVSFERRMVYRKETLLHKNKADIIKMLEEQLVERFFSDEGKYERRLDYQKDVDDAAKILLDQSRYNRLLSK